MTPPGNPNNNLEEKTAQILALILGAPKQVDEKKEKELNPQEIKRVINEDRDTSLQPLPVKPVKKGANSDWTRAKALRILELRVQGHSFDDIAQILDYKSGKHVRAAYTRLMDKHEKESVESLRQLQNERLEMAWQGLAPKVAQGRERAVEVAMKVLERQARLQGIDMADAPAEKVTNQAIQINIMAHPDDPKAREMVIEHQPRQLTDGS